MGKGEGMDKGFDEDMGFDEEMFNTIGENMDGLDKALSKAMVNFEPDLNWDPPPQHDIFENLDLNNGKPIFGINKNPPGNFQKLRDSKNPSKPFRKYANGDGHNRGRVGDDRRRSNSASGGRSTNTYFYARGLNPTSKNNINMYDFKMAYGTRGLLADDKEPNIELAPGIIQIMDRFNNNVDQQFSFKNEKMVDCFNASVRLLKYATDYIHHKTYLIDYDIDKVIKFFIPTQNINNNPLQNLTCQTGFHLKNDNFYARNTLQKLSNKHNDIIQMVESNDIETTIKEMLKCIYENYTDRLPDQRNQMQIFNIYDINISPINYNALQRELAFANIYNYSYSFDKYIHEYLSVENIDLNLLQNPKYIIGVQPNQTKFPADYLIHMLVQPQSHRKVYDYLNSVWAIYSGDDGLDQMRPKYLSDQLWNKVLLHSMYSTERYNSRRYNLDQRYTHNAARNRGTGSRIFDPNGLKTDDRLNDLQTKYGNTLNEDGKMSFRDPGTTNKNNITTRYIGIPRTDVTIYQDIGYKRYHSVLVRYIEWFVNIQRIMRLFMRDKLTHVSDNVVQKINTLDEKTTDYHSNSYFDVKDFE